MDRWKITLVFLIREILHKNENALYCLSLAIAIMITLLTNRCSTKKQPTVVGNLVDVTIWHLLKLLSKHFPQA